MPTASSGTAGRVRVCSSPLAAGLDRAVLFKHFQSAEPLLRVVDHG